MVFFGIILDLYLWVGPGSCQLSLRTSWLHLITTKMVLIFSSVYRFSFPIENRGTTATNYSMKGNGESIDWDVVINYGCPFIIVDLFLSFVFRFKASLRWNLCTHIHKVLQLVCRPLLFCLKDTYKRYISKFCWAFLSCALCCALHPA